MPEICGLILSLILVTPVFAAAAEPDWQKVGDDDGIPTFKQEREDDLAHPAYGARVFRGLLLQTPTHLKVMRRWSIH
jgi:hypothetical protein